MRFRHSLLIIVPALVALLGTGLARAQGGNGITSPTNGQTVSGSVQILGTATLPDFLRYELHFSANDQDWVYFTGGPAPVIGGVLGYWDTVGARVPDGRYTIRLRVVRQDSNYEEYYVRGLIVANSAPPTAAITPTPLEQPDTPTPRPTNAVPAGTITVTVELPPTRVPVTSTPTRAAGERPTPGSLIPQLPPLGTAGVSEAFANGVKITGGLFLVMAAYVFLRGGLRWTLRNARRYLYRRRWRGGR
jgi:hypothetical protein